MTDPLYIVLVCTACGVAGGILYDAIVLLRRPFLQTWVRIGTDMLFCMLFASGYLLISVWLGFPDLRLYYFASFLLGFWIYLKSLHKTVAFLAKKIYNTIKPIQKEKKLCPKREERVLRRKKSERS